MEMRVGEQNCQWYGREASTSAQVQHFCSWRKLNESRDGQRVQDMVDLKIINVLARYDINLGIPLRIECEQRLKLLPLRWRQLIEIMVDCLHDLPKT